MEPLRPLKLFSISMDEAHNSKAIINCYCSIAHLKHDDCELTLSDARRSLIMQCSIHEEELKESASSTYFRQKIRQWIPEQADETNIGAFIRAFPHFRQKFMVLLQCAVNNVEKSFVKLEFQSARRDFPVPIQPGLFKGTYSDSGIQLVKLVYANQHAVHGIKITVLYIDLHPKKDSNYYFFFTFQGDQNCPAGYSTFQVDLKYSIYLNEMAQSSMEIIQQMDVVPNVLNWNEVPTSQPFILPQGCNDQHLVVPDQCRARYLTHFSS